VSPRDEWARLAHGFQVNVRIVLTEQPDALKVPLTALFRDGGEWAVFVLSGGRAESRHVSLGERNGVDAAIAGGLAEGERVVLHPSDRVANGVRLAPR
jgi:HlyD family secretion protein